MIPSHKPTSFIAYYNTFLPFQLEKTATLSSENLYVKVFAPLLLKLDFAIVKKNQRKRKL